MFRKILPFIVIAVMAGGAWLVSSNPPQVNRSARPSVPAMTVQVQTLDPVDYPLIVERFGRVVAHQRTPLVAEAGGEILYLAPELREGGFFRRGQLLIQLDDARYRAELEIARASLTESRENFAEQQALAEQARQAWLLSGQSGEPSDRVLRKPQLKAAAAQVKSAESSLRLAQLSLAKTKIFAPFDGSVATLNVEQGQAISSGAEIATLIADSAPEVEVALHQRDLDHLNLNTSATMNNPPKAEITDNGRRFAGEVIRTAAELDSASQQLMARVQIKNSIGGVGSDESGWPRVGSLVRVAVEGKHLSQVIVIPNVAVYQNRYVYKVTDGRLQRQDVILGWQDDAFSVVESGLNPGDQLVVTPLGQVTSGTLVTVSSEDTSISDDAVPTTNKEEPKS